MYYIRTPLERIDGNPLQFSLDGANILNTGRTIGAFYSLLSHFSPLYNSITL